MCKEVSHHKIHNYSIFYLFLVEDVIFDILKLLPINPSRQINALGLKLDIGNENRQVFVQEDIIFHMCELKPIKYVFISSKMSFSYLFMGKIFKVPYGIALATGSDRCQFVY
jgi:hypothetical protein